MTMLAGCSVLTCTERDSMGQGKSPLFYLMSVNPTLLELWLM